MRLEVTDKGVKGEEMEWLKSIIRKELDAMIAPLNESVLKWQQEVNESAEKWRQERLNANRGWCEVFEERQNKMNTALEDLIKKTFVQTSDGEHEILNRIATAIEGIKDGNHITQRS